jgi:hypothetical protein
MKLRVGQLFWRAVFVFTAVLMCAVPARSHQEINPAVVAQIPPPSTKCPFTPGVPPSAACVELGRQVFETQTFNGNGRTCATCHPASNNFTIDPAYISNLPSTDPLFVAEFNPALRNLELPPPASCPSSVSVRPCSVLRSNALICENLDGFGNPCVLRSVPHLQGLNFTISPDSGVNPPNTAFDISGVTSPPARPVFPLAAALGWSGDGSPGDGSLRNFAVGAVVQHFTQSLNRVPGVDFRMPTADELNELVAFQLSLGRQSELNLNPDGAGNKITDSCANSSSVVPCTDFVIIVPSPAPTGLLQFTDTNVTTGQNLFFLGSPSNPRPIAPPTNVRQCSGCHFQAGGGSPSAIPASTNRNRGTGAEMSPLAPPCLPNGTNVLNGDGGFGAGPLGFPFNTDGSPVPCESSISTTCVKPFPDYNLNASSSNPITGGNTPTPEPVDVGLVTTMSRGGLCGTDATDAVTFSGTHFFNIPTVIEAASTVPLFHNNIAQTVEEAVLFYTTPAFNNSITGAGGSFLLGDFNGTSYNPGGGSRSDPNCAVMGSTDCTRVQQIGAFLRGINALDSESSAVAYLGAALNTHGPEKVSNIQLAIHKIGDAIGVLSQCTGKTTDRRLCGPLALFGGRSSSVINSFQSAENALQVQGKSPNALNSLHPSDLTAAQGFLATACAGMLQQPSQCAQTFQQY